MALDQSKSIVIHRMGTSVNVIAFSNILSELLETEVICELDSCNCPWAGKTMMKYSELSYKITIGAIDLDLKELNTRIFNAKDRLHRQSEICAMMNGVFRDIEFGVTQAKGK